MWTPLLLLAGCTPALTLGQDLVPREWLVLAPVDEVGRRPLRPDAVLLRWIAPPDAPAPEAGQAVLGELGQEQRWEARGANERGELPGAIGYAYAKVEVARREVRLARVDRATTFYLNGAPFAGDRYGLGFGGVPVVLEAGVNHLFVTGARGAPSVQLLDVEPGLMHGAWDDTLPDLVAGEAPRGALGLQLLNAAEAATGPLWIEARGPGVSAGPVRYEGLSALGVDQFALVLSGAGPGADAPSTVEVEVGVRTGSASGEPVLTFPVTLTVRRPGAPVLRTYVSGVDGSVQRYAVVPPAAPRDGESAPSASLVLSLHGAGVTAWGQASCYAQRPGVWVVAPENRRAYGFDWQDWGRRDAYDVLALGLAESGVARGRVHVTGHSMGGHGTWHLAANDADGFASCAPSAGWASFDSYGGRPEGELRALWHAADGTSQTLALIDNLRQLPVYVLHGTADRNVPAREALKMMDALTEAGGTFEAHFEGGAGHWWGNRCVDWPPLFDFFAANEIPAAPAAIDFTTVAPRVDAAHHWVRVEQPRHYGAPVRVRGEWSADERSATLTTENARLLAVDLDLATLTLDGQELTLGEGMRPRWFRWSAGSWSAAASGPQPFEKRAARSGTLKSAFDRNFLMVVGTRGDDGEDVALLDRARYDAGAWRYRGNGRAEIWTDEEFLAREASTVGRNLILYGNSETNGAWGAALSSDCPIQVTRTGVRLVADGVPRELEGDGLACAFVRPRLGQPEALVGVFADTSPGMSRLASLLAPFVSGVGYPDYVVYDARIASAGDGGVRAAGWFDWDWRLRALALR